MNNETENRSGVNSIWHDTSFYLPASEIKIPYRFRADFGGMVVILQQDMAIDQEWELTCKPFFTRRPLSLGLDIQGAQREAIAILREIVTTIAAAISSSESAIDSSGGCPTVPESSVSYPAEPESHTSEDGVMIHRAQFNVCDPCVKLEGQDDCKITTEESPGSASDPKSVVSPTVNVPEIEAIKERRAKISPAPWKEKWASYIPPDGSPGFGPLATEPLQSNANFIAHAPADVDYLLTALAETARIAEQEKVRLNRLYRNARADVDAWATKAVDETAKLAAAQPAINSYPACLKVVEALRAVAMVAGNLSDEAVEAVGGVNDARSRALMVVSARAIARAALKPFDSQLEGNKWELYT